MADQYRFDDSEGPRGPRHVHLLNDKPLYGTTTVLNVLAKPLTWWAAGLAVGHLGWTPINDPVTKKKAPREPRIEAAFNALCHIQTLDGEAYLNLLDEAYRAHSVKLDTSAEAGTDMHAELEAYTQFCIEQSGGVPCDMKEYTGVDEHIAHDAVQRFSEWAIAGGVRFIASEAYCYSKRLWTGGIVDLIYEDKDGNWALLDFKSAKDAYDAHFMQNAAYDIALTENGILTRDGDLVSRTAPFHHYSVLPFGMPEPKVIHRENIQDYKDSFEACVTIHRLSEIGKNKSF